MSQELNRVRVEGIDWANLFPVTRLLGSFRMAIHPVKLGLGLLLAVLLYMGGLGLDIVWGPSVHEQEVERYQTLTRERYELFITQWNQAAAQRPKAEATTDPRQGIFHTLLREEIDAFDQLIDDALRFDFGLTAFLSGQPDQGVIGAIIRMVIVIPGWLYHTHPVFLATYLIYTFVLLCLFGGAISRHAALQATVREPPTIAQAVAFAVKRYAHLALTPLTPVVLVLVVALVLAVAGLILFNVPVLDLLGGLGFGLLLFGGLIIALVLIGLFASSGLMFPAIAVEGADFFDAVSRSFGYVIGRPWRWLFYNAVMVVYGALTYLFVGLVVFLTLWATKSATDLLVFREAAGGVSRFDAMLSDPQLGKLVPAQSPHARELSWSGKSAMWMISVWVRLLILLMPAFAVSFYFSAQTWIYLLLRRSADGIDYDEVYREAGPDDDAKTTPDKVEDADPGETGSSAHPPQDAGSDEG